MPAAVCACVASRTFWSSVERASSFCTTVNCAVSDMNCVGSDGLEGSWYLSWATRSLRNVSWSRLLERAGSAPDVPAVVLVPVVALVPPMVVMALLPVAFPVAFPGAFPVALRVAFPVALSAGVGSDADVEAPGGRRRRGLAAGGAPAAGRRG